MISTTSCEYLEHVKVFRETDVISVHVHVYAIYYLPFERFLVFFFLLLGLCLLGSDGPQSLVDKPHPLSTGRDESANLHNILELAMNDIYIVIAQMNNHRSNNLMTGD